MDMKLEVLIIPVSDVDRAKSFYEKLGFRLDIDYAAKEEFRGVQFTPPGSEASIIFGKGITFARPGSIDGLVLVVYDIEAARKNLIALGVDVSEVFHYAGAPSTVLWRTRASTGVTQKVVHTTHLSRSRIRMGTGGCSRRSGHGFPTGSGRRDHRPWTM
jgi:predicted enzyme related to lactoylglutathione lyase